jgi:hypothetical protein
MSAKVHPTVKRIRAAIKHIPGAWVRHYADDAIWAGHSRHTALSSDEVQRAIETAGFHCERNGKLGTCGVHIIEVFDAPPVFNVGDEVSFAPPLSEELGGRRWGGCAPPSAGVSLSVDEVRSREDGTVLWYGVENDAGTRWRVWANQLKAWK